MCGTLCWARGLNKEAGLGRLLALSTGEVTGGSELCIKHRPDRLRRVLGDISPLVRQAPWQLWALINTRRHACTLWALFHLLIHDRL